MSKLFFICLLLVSKNLQATDVMGGHVVVCSLPGQAVTVRLLEFFQAESVGQKIDLGSVGQPYSDYLRTMLQRLEPLSPLRVKIYNESISSFVKEWKFSPQLYIPLKDIVTDVILPKDCVLQQIAYQNKIEDEETQYIVDQRFWSLLPEMDKAGFIMHQFLLKESLTYKKSSSDSVRVINALIATNRIALIKTPRAWAYFLDLRNFELTDMCSAGWADIYHMNFKDDERWGKAGHLKNFTPKDEKVITVYGSLPSANIHCDDEGRLKKIFITEGYSFKIKFKSWEYYSKAGSGFSETIEFDKEGRVRFINKNYPDREGVYDISVSENGNIIGRTGYFYENKDQRSTMEIFYPPAGKTITVYVTMDLYDSGSPKRIMLRKDTALLNQAGALETYFANTEVVLSPDGRVLAALPGI